MKQALIFPGQGAQYPGMGKDFYENFPAAKEVFEQADDLLSMRLSKLMFEGPQEVLTETKNSQLAIFVMSLALYAVIGEKHPDTCAGLSLGEYSALVASKRLSFEEGLLLVRDRGQFMNDACEKTQGTMAVVLGLKEEDVAAALSGLKDVWIANLNCPGQVVIAGSKIAISSAEATLKAKGAKRVLPLQVSGAFHSPFMHSAQERLAPKIHAANFKDSAIRLVMNVPGDYVESSEDVRQNLIDQVVQPVRWESGVHAMEREGIERYIEIGPGKTLCGMNKKIGISAPCINIEKVEDLDAVFA
ncbi:MAG: ACP S-malonyltransferase [Chlamydiia bacterium]|nr:ACP S-malonyltransferase [Chlamydiia bacterium]